MNYRWQLSPLSGTRESQAGLSSSERWQVPFSHWENAKFYRSWLVYDFNPQGAATRGIDWNVLLGLAFTVGVSASFWTGVGLLIARVWN